MLTALAKLRRLALVFAVGASLVLSGVGSATTGASTTSRAARQGGGAPVPGLLGPNDQTWTPEALEDLLAPVALYPDEFIGHVLVAATNPQEVLDAGNWRPKNQNLAPDALDDAAKRAGFTPPVRMLLQNPVVLDMMCSEFGWTQELGQAYVNDQEGVLSAIQRLRHQARDAGNLESSDQMVVETVTTGGQEAITLTSPNPDVLNVPQYDVDRVYTSLDDDDDDDGVSLGTTVLTSALAFGGGLALGFLFDDDDDDWDDDDYYQPVYYGPPAPYYPHYAYQPAYAGYYPATVYAPPPAYPYAYSNTTVVRRDVNTYWNRYDDRTYTRRGARQVASPITKARPNRPELADLNARARRGPARRAPAVAEERRAYPVKKREAAARAEARRAAKAERRAAGADRSRRPAVDAAGNPAVERVTKPGAVQPRTPAVGGAGKPTVEPITVEPADKPGVERAGSRPGGRGVDRARGRAGAGGAGRAAGDRARGGNRAKANAGDVGADPAAPRAGRRSRATPKAGAAGADRAAPKARVGGGESATPGAGADRAAPKTAGGAGARKAGGGRNRARQKAGGAAGEGGAQKAGGGGQRAAQKAGSGGQRAAQKAGGRGGGRRRGPANGRSTEPAKPAPPPGGASAP